RTASHSREPCGPVASAAAAPPPDSTRIERPGSAPLPPAREAATVGTATCPHRKRHHRQPRAQHARSPRNRLPPRTEVQGLQPKVASVRDAYYITAATAYA